LSEQEQIQVQKEEQKSEQAAEEEEEYNEIIDVLAQQILEENEEEYAHSRWLKRLRKLGIVMAEMYHCKRCNHLWLPKDFDASFNQTEYVARYLEHRQPPKACARCKSKLWNSPPKRKTKHTADDAKHRDMFQNIIGNNDKMKLFGHDMITAQRLRLAYRKLRKMEIDADEAMKDLEEKAKKFNIDPEKYQEEEQHKTPEQKEAEWLDLKKRMFEGQKLLQQKDEEREKAEQLEGLKKMILLGAKKDPKVLELLKGAKEEYEKEKETKT
jgi:hypothetical protein